MNASASQTAEIHDISEAASVPHIQRHNFLVMAFYQISLRCGWIFKTESIVMPAFLDALGVSAWVRGFLPLFNRFGQSVPPMLLASSVAGTKQKKTTVMITMLLFAVSFFAIAFIWNLYAEEAWMPAVFLLIYALFFMVVGVHNLAARSVQGKLIRANRRGRLMLAGNVGGAIASVSLAYWLFPKWLPADGSHDFFGMFSFAGIMFVVCAFIAVVVIEPKDPQRKATQRLSNAIQDAKRTFREDPRFRRIALIGALTNTSIMLFPHYQPIAKEYLHLSLDNLMPWVIAQNLGMAVFSMILGPIADLKGNRAVIRLLLIVMIATPLLALFLIQQPWGGKLYWVVFVLVGMTPFSIGILFNYTLELTESSNHPRYLATLGLVVALPAALSPVVSYSMDLFGSPTPLFASVSFLLLIAWVLTFLLPEPRFGEALPEQQVEVTQSNSVTESE